MPQEPQYIDEDDVEGLWGDTDWKYLDYLENLHLVHEAFSVTRRTAKRFRTESERKRWERITNGVSNGKIPEEWVKNMIEWARDKNRGLIAIAITLPLLTKAILNKANMTDWLSRHPQSAKGTFIGPAVDLGGSPTDEVRDLSGDPYEEEHSDER